MAKVNGPFELTGAYGTGSFYKNRGSSQVLLRTKGGPTSRRMKVGPEFANVRRHQKEWGACVRFSQNVALSLGEVYKFADHNVSAIWNGIGKRIIQLDEIHLLGERDLELSKCREALEGFNLNRQFAFNSVVRVSPTATIDRETFSAKVTLPRINPEYDLFNVQKLPYYRIVFTLGEVNDLIFDREGSSGGYIRSGSTAVNGFYSSHLTEWRSTVDTYEEEEINLAIDLSLHEYLSEDSTYLLGIGIQFAKIGFLKKIEPVKYACCGKILMVR